MTPYPFTRVSRSEFATIKAKIRARKAKRAESAVLNADLKALAANGEAPPRPAKAPIDRKRTKRPKKSLFVRLRDALDKEAQAYAAKRDEPLGCRIAKARNCTGKSELGYHLIPRGKWSVRWDVDFRGIGNIVGACGPCNAGERWHRLDYADRHREVFGEEFYEALWAQARQTVKHTSTGMQAMLDRLRKLKTELEK